MNIDQPPNTSGRQHPYTLESRYFLLIFCISAIFLGRILWPFWSILILSFLLASLFRPLYSFFSNRQISAPFASLLTCALIIFLVFIPLLLFIGALSNEALSLYQWGRDAGVGIKIHTFLQKSPTAIQTQTYLQGLGLNFEPAQLTDTLSSFIKTGGLFLYNQASSWAANILKFLALFCMMILIIFFLLIDQEKLVTFFIRLSPLPDHEDRLLLAKFEETANAILKGTIVCGLIQGIIIGAVFAIFGLNAPILWGCVMAVVACLPIPGIGLIIIIPTAMILAINGSPGTGIVISLFYMLLSFSIEYIIKPKMVGGQVKMHTLLVFLSLMGGITVYGILGIIYGPLIVTAFLTLSDLYLARYDLALQRNHGKQI